MQEVRTELDRLGRGWARVRGLDGLRRAHLVLLILLLVLSCVYVVLGTAPVADFFAERPLRVALLCLALVVLVPAVLPLLARWMRPDRRTLARRLDDSQGWHDAADAALTAPGTGSVGLFLRAQTLGRLRELDPTLLWPARGGGGWIRGVLVVLIALLLLLPGVSGWGPRGAGGDGSGALGSRPFPEPMDADAWLQRHARLFLHRGETPDALLTARAMTDEPLPAPWAARLVLVWDGVEVEVGHHTFEAGERVDHSFPIDVLGTEALAEHLGEGPHQAQAFLIPTAPPFTWTVPSPPVEVHLEGGGGGGDSSETESEGEAPPEEPPPDPPPPPPGPEPGEPPPPPETERAVVVVEPLLPEDAETAPKEDAIVAVKDPDAGTLEPPAPEAEALPPDFERLLERAMGRERVGPRDRAFLVRYFRALERASKGDGG